MKGIMGLVIWMILFNLAGGIIENTILTADGTKIFGNSEDRMGMTYDADDAADFEGTMNKSISPSGEMEDKGNAIYRVLDTMNIGFIQRFIQGIQHYLYGFVKILQNTIGPFMGETTAVIFFGMLRTVITVIYLLGIWSLWTGKEANE
ncbi:hypothetical protein CMI37_05915 [Candidatus Pacearchaeota archaeon]|jgi:hypothetical protein|nr:hypothetical protein [Candidatus Pacearchaeota archaeon]|tara:strand:- start:4284 stop:4727 length:444 start_codon:yes stop_codon:yes gene_type:complete